jgi:hypothetical protein
VYKKTLNLKLILNILNRKEENSFKELSTAKLSKQGYLHLYFFVPNFSASCFCGWTFYNFPYIYIFEENNFKCNIITYTDPSNLQTGVQHPDPYVFGPPTSASGSVIYLFGSGSSNPQAKSEKDEEKY